MSIRSATRGGAISRRRALPCVSSLILAAVAGQARADVPDVPEVPPGGDLAFPAPDGEPETSGDVTPGVVCTTGSKDGVLCSVLLTTLAGSKGVCEVKQQNDFRVEQGHFDSVILVRVSGSTEVSGYQQLIGLGQVETRVSVLLIDLGLDLASAADDRVVACEDVSRYELTQTLQPSVGAEASIDLGSATVLQGGLDLGFGMALPLNMRIIRDDNNFGFEALVRRGRTYRVVVRSRSQAKLSTAAGFAVANFCSLDSLPQVPANLFDPKYWLETSNLPIKNLAIPNINVSGLKLFTFPELKIPEFQIPPIAGIDVPPVPEIKIVPATDIVLPNGIPSTHAALNTIGISPDILSLLGDDLIGLGQSFLKEEGITGGGVKVTNLSLRVQEDAREASARALVEANLARAKDSNPIASLFLPAEFGGRLELVRDVVAELVEKMTLAGEDVGNAVQELGAGDIKRAEGKYKKAYDYYRLAYASATAQ